MEMQNNELHDRIKKLRINNGYTQQQLANILHVDKSTYAHYEGGRRTPNAEKLKILADFYGLKDELLGARLPVVTKVEYPAGMLEKFERELNAAKDYQGKTTMELIALYRHLDKEFRPIWEARMQAFDFPNLPLEFYEKYAGQTIQEIKLNLKGEYLIEKYLNLQKNIFEAIQAG